MTNIETVDVLFDMAQQTLDEIVSQFEELGVDLPERRYVNIGGMQDSAHDCEQLTVTLEQHYPGTPSEQAEVGATCTSPRTLAMVVELVRCIPNMQAKGRGGAAYRPPNPEEMTEYTKQRAKDMLILLEAGSVISDRFYEWNGMGITQGGMFDVTPGTPSGNMQGLILNLIVLVPTW